MTKLDVKLIQCLPVTSWRSKMTVEKKNVMFQLSRLKDILKRLWHVPLLANCSHYVYQYSKAVSTVQNNQNLVFNSSYGSLRGREEELKKREENSNPTTPLAIFFCSHPFAQSPRLRADISYLKQVTSVTRLLSP